MERYVGKHQKEAGHQTRDIASPVDYVRSPGVGADSVTCEIAESRRGGRRALGSIPGDIYARRNTVRRDEQPENDHRNPEGGELRRDVPLSAQAEACRKYDKKYKKNSGSHTTHAHMVADIPQLRNIRLRQLSLVLKRLTRQFK
jgi:hypothetical protein